MPRSCRTNSAPETATSRHLLPAPAAAAWTNAATTESVVYTFGVLAGAETNLDAYGKPSPQPRPLGVFTASERSRSAIARRAASFHERSSRPARARSAAALKKSAVAL